MIAGLPTIPARLVEKIQSGQFVELSGLQQLLPDHIGSLSGNPALDYEDKAKQTKRQVTSYNP